MENPQNKIELNGCKWSSLNVPGTEIPMPQAVQTSDPLFYVGLFCAATSTYSSGGLVYPESRE